MSLSIERRLYTYISLYILNYIYVHIIVYPYDLRERSGQVACCCDAFSKDAQGIFRIYLESEVLDPLDGIPKQTGPRRVAVVADF